jgi:hypothetical protein
MVLPMEIVCILGAKLASSGLPQIRHVDVGSKPRVIGQIPARMIRVLVNHDRIGIPKPIGDIRIIEWSDGKVEAVEPEAVTVTTLEMEDMAGPEATPEVTVLEGALQMKSAVSRSPIVSDPAAIVLDVRSIRVAGGVPESVLPFRGRRWSSHGRGSVRRDVASSESLATVFLTPLPLLGIAGYNNYQKRYQETW